MTDAITEIWDGLLHAATHELNEAERKLRQINGRWDTTEAEVVAHIQEARLLVVESAKRVREHGR